jgi:hypothetical protein
MQSMTSSVSSRMSDMASDLPKSGLYGTREDHFRASGKPSATLLHPSDRQNNIFRLASEDSSKLRRTRHRNISNLICSSVEGFYSCFSSPLEMDCDVDFEILCVSIARPGLKYPSRCQLLCFFVEIIAHRFYHLRIQYSSLRAHE